MKIYCDLKKIFKNRIPSMLEVLYVYENVKTSCRLIVNSKQLFNLIKLCRKFNLEINLEKFRINPVKDSSKAGYSNSSEILPFNSKQGSFIIYISENKTDILSDPKNLGLNLGYPKCCVNFYLKNLDYVKKDAYHDLVLQAIPKRFKIFPFYTNIAIRYFGIQLLSHFPCSFDCKKSIEIAKTYLNCVKKYDSELANFLIQHLSSFVVYTQNKGVFYSPNYKMTEKNIKFHKLKGTVKNGLFSILNKNKKIKINSPRSFFIKDELLNSDVFLLAFKK